MKALMQNTVADLRESITQTRCGAEMEARREFGTLRSRKAQLTCQDENGERIGEPEDWTGTQKQIWAALKDGAFRVYVTGDFEDATHGDILDGGEWEVLVGYTLGHLLVGDNVRVSSLVSSQDLQGQNAEVTSLSPLMVRPVNQEEAVVIISTYDLRLLQDQDKG